jgi:uncharacterized protein
MTSQRLIAGLVAILWVHDASAGNAQNAAREGMVERSDLEIVECLLPGELRRVGNMEYLAPRRPVRTTTADCRTRGGEYVAYDRADVGSALHIWLNAAQDGNADAQNNVGGIYERGVGGEPDYVTAAHWYELAANQGNTRALINLGFLYERGLGVDKDPLRALDLYRRASGLPQNSVIYADSARREKEALRDELTRVLAEKNAQIDALQKQVEELEHKMSNQTSNPELDALRGLVKQLRADRLHAQTSLANIGPSSPATSNMPPPLDPQVAIQTVMGQKIGRFYALLIGNQNYLDAQAFEKLQTAHNDAERTARLLRDKYGFSVQIINDADENAMYQALNNLYSLLKPEDNLLIYYAGHGRKTQTGKFEMGFWLPVNAAAPPSEFHWISNMQISAQIGHLRARRVLVLADSCYAGLLSGDPSATLFGADAPVTAEYLKFKLPKRSRLLLASGGDHPVPDAGGKGDSVFAHALLDVLETNTGVLTAPGLFIQIRARVQREAAEQSIRQVPDLKSINEAGHDLGDFFFVPGARS